MYVNTFSMFFHFVASLNNTEVAIKMVALEFFGN